MNEHRAAERIIKGQRDENGRLQRVNTDLLAALEACLGMIEAWERTRDWYQPWQDVVGKARAAIEKARDGEDTAPSQ